jgi:hypothetical protein
MVSACQFDDSPVSLASVEYIDSTTIKVAVLVSDASVPYEVNDNTLSVYSTKHDFYYRITETVRIAKAEYKCLLRRNLKPGDKVRVNGSGSLSGSVFFDVPGGE